MVATTKFATFEKSNLYAAIALPELRFRRMYTWLIFAVVVRRPPLDGEGISKI